MRELTGLALDTARARGAAYADVRVVERREQIVGVKNGVVESLSETEDCGFGVRVIAGGPGVLPPALSSTKRKWSGWRRWR